MQKMRILLRKSSAIGVPATSTSVGATQTRKVSVTLRQVSGNKAYVVSTSGCVTIHIRRSDFMCIKRVEELSVKSPGIRNQIASIT